MTTAAVDSILTEGSSELEKKQGPAMKYDDKAYDQEIGVTPQKPVDFSKQVDVPKLMEPLELTQVEETTTAVGPANVELTVS